VLPTRLNERDERYVIAGFGQFDRRAAHFALLIAFLCGCLLKLRFILVGLADVVLRAVLEENLTTRTRRFTACSARADSVRDAHRRVRDMRRRVEEFCA
jgi:hypothetical protein